MKTLIIIALFISCMGYAAMPPVSFTLFGSSPNSKGASVVGNAITLQPADATHPGPLSASDWNLFNSKESTISQGTSLQYWRGDKTFQTLNSAAVPELTNLYYTDARVQTVAKNNISAQEFWVSKDVGSDSNDCSFLKPCQTIQAGINAANPVSAYYRQSVVHVSPNIGSAGYAENITLSQQGVNLLCDAPQSNTRACLIAGSVTVNLTGTAGGVSYIADSNEAYMSGFVIFLGSPSATTALTFSGTQFQRFNLVNSYIQQNGTGTAVAASNSGSSSGGTKSTMTAWDTTLESKNATNPTVSITSTSRFWMFGTQSAIQQSVSTQKAVIQSGAGSSFVCNICAITGQVQVTSNTANATLNLSSVTSGSSSCVDTPSSPSTGVITLAYFGCTSTNTNSVTGSGVVVPIGSSARISTGGDIVSTVTQAVLPGFPIGEIQLGAGAVSGTNVLLSIKGGHIKVAQTAPTATVNANAGTGATCTVANATDTAGLVTITTGSIGVSTGAYCGVNFNKAYGVAPICVLTPASSTLSTSVYVTSSTTVMTVNFALAGGLTSAYALNYHCLETQ